MSFHLPIDNQRLAITFRVLASGGSQQAVEAKFKSSIILSVKPEFRPCSSVAQLEAIAAGFWQLRTKQTNHSCCGVGGCHVHLHFCRGAHQVTVQVIKLKKKEDQNNLYRILFSRPNHILQPYTPRHTWRAAPIFSAARSHLKGFWQKGGQCV